MGPECWEELDWQFTHTHTHTHIHTHLYLRWKQFLVGLFSQILEEEAHSASGGESLPSYLRKCSTWHTHTHTRAREIKWNPSKSTNVPSKATEAVPFNRSTLKNDQISCSEIKLTGQPSHFHLPEERSFVHLSGCVWSDPRLWVKSKSLDFSTLIRHRQCNNTIIQMLYEETSWVINWVILGGKV